MIFFVPVTMALVFLTTLLQTAWHQRKTDVYLRLTRFFGTLLVINIAIGVITGIVLRPGVLSISDIAMRGWPAELACGLT